MERKDKVSSPGERAPEMGKNRKMENIERSGLGCRSFRSCSLMKTKSYTAGQ